MDHDANELISRARELAEHAAKISDSTIASAAQTYATLALAATLNENSHTIRTLTGWIEHQTEATGAVVGNLGDLNGKLEMLTHRLDN